MYIAYVMAWICTAAAVSVGIYYTHEPNCLWFLFIPAMLRVNRKSDDKKDRDKEKEDE